MVVKRYRKQAKVVVKRVIKNMKRDKNKCMIFELPQVLPVLSLSYLNELDKKVIDEYCSNTDCGICTNRICEIPNPPTTEKEWLDYRLTLMLICITSIDNHPMHDKADDIMNEKNSK